MGALYIAAAAVILISAVAPQTQTDQDNDLVACETNDGQKGKCVLNYQCNPETNVIDQQSLVELRIGACRNFLEICCLEKELVQEPLPTCGYSNPGASDVRIKPDSVATADFGEFPWMVALLKTTAPKEDWSQDDFLGGGSIIHPSVVITAAHKVDGLYENEVKCRAGEWDTKDTAELFASQERAVKTILTHDDFFRIQAYYNVALLILVKPFTFSEAPHIGVACLGNRMPEPGTECFTMGWGKELKNTYATTLKSLPLVDPDVCQRKLRNTRLGSRFRLHPSLTCAGGVEGVDSCKGDGGSPLVCPIGDQKMGVRYAIFGIVSSGVNCGKKNVPGIYVNVPYLYDWVVEKMNEERLEKSAFTY